MHVIYVQRVWLKTIGDVGDLLQIREEERDCVSFLAGKIEVGYPFIQADIARKEVTETGEVFLTALIPVNIISGIFDLTRKEARKFGFHPSEEG